MEAGEVKRFVSIDIADARDRLLVKQNAFDRGRAFCKHSGKRVRRELRAKRFRTELRFQTELRIALVDDHPSEFALVGKSEIPTVIEMDGEMLESEIGLSGFSQLQVPGHAEMNFDPATVVQIEEQVLPTPSDGDNPAAPELFDCHPRIGAAEHAGEGPDRQPGDRLANQGRNEREAHCFDFGEFWHTQVRDKV